jgi:hypothetical protein
MSVLRAPALSIMSRRIIFHPGLLSVQAKSDRPAHVSSKPSKGIEETRDELGENLPF